MNKLTTRFANWVLRNSTMELKKVPGDTPDLNIVPPPRGRSSVRDTGTSYFIDHLKGVKFLTQHKLTKMIPLIRELFLVDRNVGLAIHDLVLLINSGYKINFDPGVSAEQRDKMRKEIQNASKNWLEGGIGVHSIINKVTNQLLIGGAISGEWVPKKDLSGIDYVTFVNPEDILFGLNPISGRYEPYQSPHGTAYPEHYWKLGPIKLNPTTYKYIAFLGDTDSPYGVPIFISVLKDLGMQEDMLKNIAFIVKQYGILGFVSLLLKKPAQQKNEGDDAYKSRLIKLLEESKERVSVGMSDGLLVGYDDDHKYEFNSVSKEATNLGEVFNLNQMLVANGLKYTPQFMGAGTGTDTFVSVIFTKILSQLTNNQTLIASFLEAGINLHLRMKGFKYDYLNVEFLPSTVTDELKMQQSREIRARTNRMLYDDGIISHDEYADNMGYDKADMEDVRVPHDPAGIAQESPQPGDTSPRQKQKNDSAKKTREKRTPQPVRKDGKTE